MKDVKKEGKAIGDAQANPHAILKQEVRKRKAKRAGGDTGGQVRKTIGKGEC